MERYLPLFPLKLIVFPDEDLNLHIFEPRYKQLIMDIQKDGGVFGIGVYLDRLQVIGTEVELIEISNLYEDGRMDIRTQGKGLFEILNMDNPSKGKLYAGASIRYIEKPTEEPVSPVLKSEFKTYLREVFLLMSYDVDFEILDLNSYTFAHKIGLTMAEEYQVLQIPDERGRLNFLITHLKKVLPILREIETAKKKIQMNGHFKNMDPLNF